MDPAPEIRFDGWTLLRATGELLRDDRRIRLQQQPLAVLVALLERPGQLVTREELIRRLWPRGVVDFETALNTAVRRLRTALDDHAETPRYVETIPRRGYRFIATLEPSAPHAGALEPALPAGRAGWRWIPAALAAAMAAAAVATVLVNVPVERATVAGPLAAPIMTSADDHFQLAQFFLQRRGPGDLELARQHYEQALAEQPEFAPALAGLAGVYWLETLEGRLEPEQGLSRLRDAAERALALDPGLALAHLRLSQYRSVTGDRKAADWHARMAATLSPDDPLVLGFAASRAAGEGRMEDAVSLQRSVLEADPLSHIGRYNLASYLWLAGRFDEAARELKALRDLDPSQRPKGELHAMVPLQEGRPAEALELARDWVDAAPRLQVTALAQHALGHQRASDVALEGLVACCGAEDPLRVAEVYAFRGEKDIAFRWLETGATVTLGQPWQAKQRRPTWVAAHSPLLAPLHDDPRWSQWMATVQAPPSPDRMTARQ